MCRTHNIFSWGCRLLSIEGGRGSMMNKAGKTRSVLHLDTFNTNNWARCTERVNKIGLAQELLYLTGITTEDKQKNKYDHFITTSSNVTAQWTPGKNCQLSMHQSEMGWHITKVCSKKAETAIASHLRILLYF